MDSKTYKEFETMAKKSGGYVSKSKFNLCKEEGCYNEKQNGSSRCGNHKK